MKTPLLVALGAALCFASCGSTEMKDKDTSNNTNTTASTNADLKMAKFELGKVP